MSLQVEIRDDAVHEKTINGKNGPFTLRSQMGRVQLPGQSETRPVEVPVPDDEKGYPKGRYMLAPESFFVGQYDRLQVGRIRLISTSTGEAPAPGKATGA